MYPLAKFEFRLTGNNFYSNLTQICLKLNSKCHKYIQTQLREDAFSPHNIEDSDIENTISRLDPDLWKALCILTQPFSPNAVKRLIPQVLVLLDGLHVCA